MHRWLGCSCIVWAVLLLGHSWLPQCTQSHAATARADAHCWSVGQRTPNGASAPPPACPPICLLVCRPPGTPPARLPALAFCLPHTQQRMCCSGDCITCIATECTQHACMHGSGASPPTLGRPPLPGLAGWPPPAPLSSAPLPAGTAPTAPRQRSPPGGGREGQCGATSQERRWRPVPAAALPHPSLALSLLRCLTAQ